METFASYVVYAANGETYDLVANHITVTPPTETFKVEKRWHDADGKAIAWPEGAKVTVELMGNGETLDKASAEVAGEDKAFERQVVVLTADQPSAEFKPLPIYDAIDYTVEETKCEGVEEGFTTAYDGGEEEGFVVTNTFEPVKDEGKKQEQGGTKNTTTTTPSTSSGTGATTSTGTSSSGKLAQTSDPTALGTIAGLAVAGMALLTGGVASRRRKRDEER